MQDLVITRKDLARKPASRRSSEWE